MADRRTPESDQAGRIRPAVAGPGSSAAPARQGTALASGSASDHSPAAGTLGTATHQDTARVRELTGLGTGLDQTTAVQGTPVGPRRGIRRAPAAASAGTVERQGTAVVAVEYLGIRLAQLMPDRQHTLAKVHAGLAGIHQSVG